MTYNNYEILWSPSFKKELEKIYQYIAFNLNEPIIARKIYQEIIGSIESLKLFPNRYSDITLSSNLNNLNIKKLHIKNYNIIYSVNSYNNKIYILHIFHGNQNYFKFI